MAGALAGVRVIEIAGIGPGPFAATMLADHGADVIRVERPGPPGMVDPARDVLLRSRRRIAVDLKQPDGVATVRALVRSTDALIEGFRPGVMERLGLGPEALLADHPRLVYGRMTGWGQDGPLAQAAGHDIDYLAVAGVLHGIGRADGPPTPPANLLADFGGGGMMLAFGIVAALLHARATGQGQVIDCAMTDGAAMLSAMLWGFRAQELWSDDRGVNLLDGGAPFYDSYRCADGKWVAVGAIEPAFWRRLVDGLGLAGDPLLDRPMDRARWPAIRARLADAFATRPRDDWCALLDGDACVQPVLTMAEAPAHPHNAARGAFVEAGGVVQPAPAPRFGATPAEPPRMTVALDTDAILAEAGFAPDRIAALHNAGAIR